MYVGDKSHSQWKGGCCASMCHNEGDKMYLKDGVWTFTGGKNPTTPPCFQGEGKFHMEKVGGAPPMENATMELSARSRARARAPPARPAGCDRTAQPAPPDDSRTAN